jgi:uncharacterized protein YndB with AHSA1/START domain
MRAIATDSPTIDEPSCKQATGKTLDQWYAELDARGGVAAGRRELVNHVYAATAKDEWWSTTIVVEYEKARGEKEKDGLPKGYAICSTKTITAPLARVFAAFGDAADLDVWLGPETVVAFRDGGELANGDGNRASFTRIRAEKDLRLDWSSPGLAPGTKVEVLFADKGKGKTGITLNHTRIQERRDADQLRAAWARALDALKGHLEQS